MLEKGAASKLQKVVSLLRAEKGEKAVTKLVKKMSGGKHKDFGDFYRGLQDSPRPTDARLKLDDLLAAKSIQRMSGRDEYLPKKFDKVKKEVVKERLKELRGESRRGGKLLPDDRTVHASGAVKAPYSSIRTRRNRKTLQNEYKVDSYPVDIDVAAPRKEYAARANMMGLGHTTPIPLVTVGTKGVKTFGTIKKGKGKSVPMQIEEPGQYAGILRHEVQEARDFTRFANMDRKNDFAENAVRLGWAEKKFQTKYPKGSSGEGTDNIRALTGHNSLNPLVAESVRGGNSVNRGSNYYNKKLRKQHAKRDAKSKLYHAASDIEYKALREAGHNVGGKQIPLEGRAVGSANIQAEKRLQRQIRSPIEKDMAEVGEIRGKGKYKKQDKEMERRINVLLDDVAKRNAIGRPSDKLLKPNKAQLERLKKQVGEGKATQKAHGKKKPEGPALDYTK